MKVKWLLSVLATVPFAAAMLMLQSCGGEGGPLSNGGGTSISKEFLALMSGPQLKATYIGPEKCADPACHGGRSRGDIPIYTTWLETKHGKNGVTCERCHGPGSVHAQDPAAGNIITLPKVTNAVICAQCHGPKFDEWASSKHAEILDHPVENIGPGDASSRCGVCHSGLTRTRYTDEGVDYGTLTADQYTALLNDSLQVVPNTANCATCHDPHALTGNLDREGEDHQLKHATQQAASTDDLGHMITPGSVGSSFTLFNHSCAECHNGRGADGRDPKLQSSTSRPNVHDSPQFNMLLGVQDSASEYSGLVATNTPPVVRNTAHATVPDQCAHCHMGDNRHTFTVSFDTGCAPCHTAADAAARVDTLKNEIVTALFALRTKMETYAKNTWGDPVVWDYTTNIVAPHVAPAQASVPIQLKRARHNYWYVLRDGSFGVHNAAYTRYMIANGVTNMGNLGILSLSTQSTAKVDYQTMLKILQSDLQRGRLADMSER